MKRRAWWRIFGAWLMQESDLHEKQVVLLTGNEPEREQEIEQQLRELTLLPLNIKYLTLQDFQKQGRRAMHADRHPVCHALPLFSPPLIHADRPLTVISSAYSRNAGILGCAATGAKTVQDCQCAITQNTP
jgi:hypothetical protein